MPERKNRFTYTKEDEVKATLSQCWNCEKNPGAQECDAHATKPVDYAFNHKVCPQYIIEKKGQSHSGVGSWLEWLQC